MLHFIFATLVMCWLPLPLNWLCTKLRRSYLTRTLARVLQSLAVICFVLGLSGGGMLLDEIIVKGADSDILMLFLILFVVPVIVSSMQLYRAVRSDAT